MAYVDTLNHTLITVTTGTIAALTGAGVRRDRTGDTFTLLFTPNLGIGGRRRERERKREREQQHFFFCF